MKKIGKFFALTGLSLATLIVGTSCFLPEPDNSSNSIPDIKRELTIEDVIVACEQLDYVSIEIDMDIEAEWQEPYNNPFLDGTYTQNSSLGLEIKENLQSEEGDYLITGKNSRKSDYYIRNGYAFKKLEYFEYSPNQEFLDEDSLERINNSFYNSTTLLNRVGIDSFELGVFEKKEFPMEDVGSLLMFADEYDAVVIEESVLTFDLNKLLYNIFNEVGAAFENMDKDTTLGDIYAKTEIKRLIDNLSGDDDALTIYEDLAEEDMMAEDGLFAILNDYKPQAGQSFYEYIATLLDSSDFMQECGLSELFEETNTIGEILVYDLLGETEAEVEEAIDNLVKMFEGITESEFLIDLSDELNADFIFSMKGFVVTIEMDGDDLCAYHAKGEYSFKDDALTGQDMKYKLDVAYRYFQEEQALRNLSAYIAQGYKETYRDGEKKGYATVAAPGDAKKLAPTLMIEDEKVTGMSFREPFGREDVVKMTYNPRKDVYEYTYRGYKMYARVMPCSEYCWAIGFYFNNGTDKIFNYSIVDMIKENGPVAMPFDEYIKDPEEQPPVQEYIYDGFRYRYDEFTDSYILLGFREGYTVADLVIPDTANGKPVRAIASGAFEDDEILRSVVIPASIDYVSYVAFANCSNLTTVESYASVLGPLTFFKCEKLETVTLKGVMVLKGVIGYSHKLKNIVIGKDVNLIEDDAFSSWNIYYIHFEGTKAEWKAIEKGKDLGLEKVICSDGTVYVNSNS